MTMRIIPNAIAVLTLTLAVIAPTSAEISQKITADVQAAAGANSNVKVSIDGNTAILHGYVKDQNSLEKIEQAARRNGAKTVLIRVLKTH